MMRKRNSAETPAGLDQDLLRLGWPQNRLGQALEALAQHSGLCAATSGSITVPEMPVIETLAQAGRWLEWAAGNLGVEAEAVEFPLTELERGLQKACPMVYALPDRGELRFLLLLKSRGRTVALIGPDLRLYWLPVDTIRATAAVLFEAPLIRDLDRLLDTAEVAPSRRQRVRSAMLHERLATQMTGGCWLLRLPPTAPFLAQLTQNRVLHRLKGVIALLTTVYLAEIISWALIGDAALDGRLDLAWLIAWLLLIVSGVPLRLSATWLAATFALDLGRILKTRLLAGALRMDIDAVRHQGAGQLLGRVMESQALESLALNGGLTITIGVLELMFSAWILTAGAGGYLHLLALLVWLAAMSGLGWRFHQNLQGWSKTRLNMTYELVENMVGHRTRLAQEWPHRRDVAEDRSMADYLELSRKLDATIIPIAAGAMGGWPILALLALAPAFITGTVGLTKIAISLGGIMLASRAFAEISVGITSLSHAGVAWTLVTDLFRAVRAPVEPTRVLSPHAGSRGPERKLVDATDLVYRYRPGGPVILSGLNLTICHGERILLEGASGGGKSTLAALLTGLRVPESGLLLMNGLDRPSLGAGWHQLATEAPQFHENHILSGSLAFNLLMGRNWPASRQELAQAHALCLELHLGPLLDRMPAGLMQQIGETGWQLSHGERSRVFLARALLQDAPLTILDESFAALDPETLRACLKAAVAHARTLVVIAHP